MTKDPSKNHGVTKAQLEKLTHNYRHKVKKLRKGGSKPEDHNPDHDTKSIWFPREVVEELFKVNDADGLRIFFCVHDKDVMETPHDDKLTVVLVATKDGKDQLYDTPPPVPVANTMSLTSAKAAGTGKTGGLVGGQGVNHGKLCPPDQCPS